MLALVAACLLAHMAQGLHTPPHSPSAHNRRHQAGSQAPDLVTRDSKGAKWIVVTTVNYPTETIQTLAKVPGWRVVVVADLKTPKDWALAGVDFLSMEKQKQLGYSMLPLLPNNHYGRKNIGYLYAIQNGATLIYETDDDNVLRVAEPATMDTMEFYTYNQTSGGVCNPYQFFGLPHIWPRGYPLDQIKAAECNSFVREPVRPLVLQGMADLDPDVDAIYRLTQTLGVNFQKDNIASVALPEGVFCPWNSQNTLFERDALWGLLIPVTTTFRVCDIWRSYWVQRLLWEVGGHLAFGPPTVDQYRNVHTLLRDFVDEQPLYNLTGGLIELLSTWQPPRGSDLPAMMVHLGQAMADAGMWAQGDADLMAAWTADLQAVGYTFPPVRSQAAAGKAHAPPQLAPAQLPAPRTPRAWRRYRDIVLVINFNIAYAGWRETYEILMEAYRPLFSKIVITGFASRPPELPASQLFSSCEGGRGAWQYACFANVMQEHPAPAGGGFLILGDDTLINPCQMADFNTSRIWYQRVVTAQQDDGLHAFEGPDNDRAMWHWQGDVVAKMHRILESFRSSSTKSKFGAHVTERIGKNLTKAHFGGDFTDGLYIPDRLAQDFQLAAFPFREQSIFHELAVPAILGIIAESASDFQVFKPLYYWNRRLQIMATPALVLESDGLAFDAFMLHPYKFSLSNATKHFWEWWEELSCDAAAKVPSDWEGTKGIWTHNLNEDYDYKDAHAEDADGTDLPWWTWTM